MSECEENYTPTEQIKNETFKGAQEEYSMPPMGVFNENYRRLTEEKQAFKKIGNAAGLSLILVLLLSFIIGIGISFALAVVMGEKAITFLEEPAISEALQISFSLVSFTLPFIAIFKLFGFRISDLMSFKRSEKGLALPLFLFGTAFCAFANIGATYIDAFFSRIGIDYTMPEVTRPSGVFGFMLTVISTAIVPAFVEEFAIRGIILGSLRKYGDSFALIASSVCFGIMHGNFEQIPFAFFVGLFLGYTVIKTASMRVAIGIHFYNNFLSVVINAFSGRISTEAQNIIYFIILLTALILGIFVLNNKKTQDKELFRIKREAKQELLTTEGQKYRYFFTSAGIVIFGIICFAEAVLFIFI